MHALPGYVAVLRRREISSEFFFIGLKFRISDKVQTLLEGGDN